MVKCLSLPRLRSSGHGALERARVAARQFPPAAQRRGNALPSGRQARGSRPLAERSGSRGRACLMGMGIAYVVVTIMVALATSYAAVLNFVGARSVKVAADRVRLSQRWMIPFGILLACGAVGLLAGFAVAALGTAAGTGLVAYFISALSAHSGARPQGRRRGQLPGDGRRRPGRRPCLPLLLVTASCSTEGRHPCSVMARALEGSPLAKAACGFGVSRARCRACWVRRSPRRPARLRRRLPPRQPLGCGNLAVTRP
jgi:DoxX-like family